MDINKIKFYSTNGVDRCNLILFEQDSIALKLESSISNPSWPTIELEYDPTISTNSKFIQLTDYYVIVNGIDCKLELINKSISNDHAQCTFIWKDISFIKTIQDKLWNDFVDENGNPTKTIDTAVYNIDYDTSKAILFAQQKDDSYQMSIMKQSLEQNTTYVRTDEDWVQYQGDEYLGVNFAKTLWENTATAIVPNVNDAWAWDLANYLGYWNTRILQSGNTIRIFEFNEKKSESSWPISIPWNFDDIKTKFYQNLSQFNQFSYSWTIQNNVETVVDTAPTHSAYNLAKPNFIKWKPIENGSLVVMLPVQLVPKNIWHGWTSTGRVDPCSVHQFYIIPMLDTFNVYTRHKWVSSLPEWTSTTVWRNTEEQLFEIQYKVTKEPLLYNKVGSDPENTMWNVSRMLNGQDATDNGRWVPVINPNIVAKESDILRDVIHYVNKAIKPNDLKITLVTSFDSSDTKEDTSIDTPSYTPNADDLTYSKQWQSLIDIDTYSIVEQVYNDHYMKCPYCYSAGPQVRSSVVADNKAANKTVFYTTRGNSDKASHNDWVVPFLSATSYIDYKYDADGNYRSVTNDARFFDFEGYVDNVIDFTITEDSQKIIPTTVEYHGNVYEITSIKQFNLRTGYISGVCYKKFD